MARVAAACKENGARHVHVAATHGVFGRGAGENLAVSDIDSIVVTDTAGDVAGRARGFESKLVVLSSADMFARTIARVAGLEIQ